MKLQLELGFMAYSLVGLSTQEAQNQYKSPRPLPSRCLLRFYWIQLMILDKIRSFSRKLELGFCTCSFYAPALMLQVWNKKGVMRDCYILHHQKYSFWYHSRYAYSLKISNFCQIFYSGLDCIIKHATPSAENQETLTVFFFPAWIDKSQGLIQINICSAKCYWAMWFPCSNLKVLKYMY